MAYDLSATVTKAAKALLYFGVPAALVNWDAAQNFSMYLAVGTFLSAVADWLKHRDVAK